MTERNDDRSQARREAAALLGLDAEHLSPADDLRVDMVSALRLVIDSEQASVLDGGSADLAKLNIAVQSLIALLPGKELPKSGPREDPRQKMLEIYMEMRRRGEVPDEGWYQHRINALEAENERLRSATLPTAITPPTADIVPPGLPLPDAKVITPPTSDIVPPSEIGKTFVGPQRGPDDPPAKSTQVIDGKAEQPPRPLRIGEQWDPVRGFRPIPPQPNAAPAPVAPPKPAPPAAPQPTAPQTWDDSPGGRAWQAWYDAGGGLDPWADNR
jgi:hypothetical protein